MAHPHEVAAETAPAEAGGRAGWRATSTVVLIYIVLAVLLYWRVWSNSPSSRTPLGADQWLSTWSLSWTYHAITHAQNPLFSNYANYPGGVNLLNNTSLTLLGILAAPITWLFGPIATTNVLLTAGPALSATSAYFFVRRFVAWRPAAFAGGLLYGFSPLVMLHAYIHINFTFIALPPLIFLALHELIVRQAGNPVRWGLLLGLLLVAQFFVFSEVMVTTVVIGAVAVAVAVIAGRQHVRAHLKYATTGLAWTAGLSAILLAYPAWFALRGPARIVGTIRPDAQAYRADLLGVLLPGKVQLLAVHGWQDTVSHFASGENGSYLGLPLLVVVAVALFWLRHEVVVVVAAAVAGVAYVLSLGGALAVSSAPATNLAGNAVGRIPLPEALLAKLPLLGNIIPAHFAMYIPLFLGLVLACVIDRVHDKLDAPPRSLRAYALPAALAAVVLLPLLPSKSPITVGDTGTPRYFSSSAVKAIPTNSVALIFPYPSGTYPGASVWQAVAGFRFRMPGGYFLVPQPPTGHVAFTPALGYAEDNPTAETFVALGKGAPPATTPALRQSLLAQLATWHVRSVIVTVGVTPGQQTSPALTLSFFSWLLGPPATHQGNTYAWYDLTTGTGAAR